MLDKFTYHVNFMLIYWLLEQEESVYGVFYKSARLQVSLNEYIFLFYRILQELSLSLWTCILFDFFFMWSFKISAASTQEPEGYQHLFPNGPKGVARVFVDRDF